MRRTLPVLAAACAAVALAFVLVAGGSAPAQAPPPAKPNVVVVMTDDQTVEQMRVLERVRTRIGREGTTFARNFSTYPLCCPSRSTYLTGQYSHNHLVRSNQPPEGGYAKLDSTNTLPVWLQSAGYATAHIGKYLNGYGTTDPRAVPPGWSEWSGSVDPTTYNFFNYCLNVNGSLVSYGASPAIAKACPGADPRPVDYQADVYTGRAVDFIARRAASPQPYFLSVAYLAPHSGGPNGPRRRCEGSAKPAPRHRLAFQNARLPRPPGFNERDTSDKPAFIDDKPRLTPAQIAQLRTDYQCRRESLLAVDEGVGQIMDAIERTGELANTLVVFTADNGFFGGEHRQPGGKIKVYEPSVRVPALLRGPGVPRDKQVRSLTANVDLAATITETAGATPGRVLDGVSLRAVARTPSRFAGRRIVLENGPTDGAANPQYQALRTSRYKYVEYLLTGERELYDLRFDPFEQRNQAGSRRYRRVQDRLARELAQLKNCGGEACR